MDSPEIRQSAEKGLGFILDRIAKQEGRVSAEDLATGQFLVRAIEAETSGGPYGGSHGLPTANVDGALAVASRSVPSRSDVQEDPLPR